MKHLVLFATLFLISMTTNAQNYTEEELKKFQEFKKYEEYKKKQQELKETKSKQVETQKINQEDEEESTKSVIINNPDYKQHKVNTIKNSQYSANHYITIGYDFPTVGDFEDGWISTVPNTTFDSEIKFESGFSIGYEYRNTRVNSWGSSFGVNYHAKKDVKSWKINDTKISNTDVSISILSLYADLLYRWESFYIPFGINISSINYELPETDSGEITTKGMIGANLGIGWMINDEISIQYTTMNTVHNPTYRDSKDELYFGYGHLTTYTLSLRFKFK